MSSLSTQEPAPADPSPPAAAAPPCSACDSATVDSLLSPAALSSLVPSALPLWAIVPHPSHAGMSTLQRSYVCKNFKDAIKSLDDVGVICEAIGHHADLHLERYREVRIVMYTHSLGGVTMYDVDACKKIDEEVKVGYSPKWLKENPHAKGTEA